MSPARRAAGLTAAALLMTSLLGAQAAPPKWDLVRDLRIGSVDDPSYDLSAVKGLAVGPGGQIYVGQRYEIRLFDARGKFVRTIGRRGSGPGEFQQVGGIGWRGDTLWATDDPAYRINLFTPRGDAVQTLRVDAPLLPGASRPTRPAGMLADGSVVGRPYPGQERLEGADDVLVPFVQMTRAGRPIRSFGLVSVTGEYGTMRGPRSALNFSLPVQTHSLWDLAADGSSLVVVDRPASGRPDATYFRVVRYGTAGRVAFERRFPYRPRPFPGAVRDSLREKMVGILLERRLRPVQGTCGSPGGRLRPHPPLPAAGVARGGGPRRHHLAAPGARRRGNGEVAGAGRDGEPARRGGRARRPHDPGSPARHGVGRGARRDGRPLRGALPGAREAAVNTPEDRFPW